MSYVLLVYVHATVCTFVSGKLVPFDHVLLLGKLCSFKKIEMATLGPG